MATATLNAPNGRHAYPTSPTSRRTLNDSIARLDDILDGLGEAIPATIHQALRDSVGAAVAEGVKAALVEVMTNPQFAAKLQPPTTAPAKPSFLARLGEKVIAAFTRVKNWIAPQAAVLRDNARESVGKIRETGNGLLRRLRWIAGCRQAVGLAVLIGFCLASVAYLSPPTFAGLIAGIAGTLSALGIQFALWVRRNVSKVMVR